MAGKLPLILLSLLSLTLLSQSGSLDASDSFALRCVMTGFGLQSERMDNPCGSAGISCERRISGESSRIRITRIVLKSQRLRGFLSPEIGRLSELKELSLPNNHLSNKLPSDISNCRKLEVLNLRDNNFSGEMPSGLSSLVTLRSLDLSSNRFSGNLSFLKYFPKLENLSLSDNLFTGKIPRSLKSFQNLRFVNLTGNFLPNPESPPNIETPSSFGLHRYRLAENSTASRRNRSGKVPSSANTAAPAPAPTTSPKEDSDGTGIGAWILGFFAGAIAGILTGLIFSLLFRILLNCIRNRGKIIGPDIYSPMIKKAEDLAFLEKEDGLQSLEIIGHGGCGEVYRADLPGPPPKSIAIKKIKKPEAMEAADISEEDSKLLNKMMRQLQSEIKTVGHIRHRNLLPLLAHVARPDCHLLIYEFMKNGSLHDVLHQVAQGTRELEWQVRHKIALGIAAGLEYLHLYHSPRIIHRDLKPANVLLDDDLEARITDFGLAKAMPEANTHVSSSNVVGTLGYIAPEYHLTLKFTDKCDIYSFGVVLVGLVMGKSPSDVFFQNTDELSLVKWLRNVMASEDPKRAVDPKLLGNGFEEQMLLVLKIACFCTLDDPKKRPNSKEVRTMLAQIRP